MKSLLFLSRFWALVILLGMFSSDLMAESQYILFRHAEKQLDAGHDPQLTEAGQQRAERIAKLLKDTEITKIYSTNYQRTLMTVAPLAKSKGLEVELYNPRELEVFAKQLKKQKGIFVIAGHSNTTPQLTQLLANREVADMDESQYSDVYWVTQQCEEISLRRTSSDD